MLCRITLSDGNQEATPVYLKSTPYVAGLFLPCLCFFSLSPVANLIRGYLCLVKIYNLGACMPQMQTLSKNPLPSVKHEILQLTPSYYYYN